MPKLKTPPPLTEAELPLTVLDETFIMLLKSNVRTPEQTVGDIFAQVSALGMMDNAWYIERATLAAERVSPLSEIRDASAPYFSMILVRRRSGAP